MKKLWNTSLVPIQWAKPHDATKMPQLLCVKLEDPKNFTSQALRRSRAVIHLGGTNDGPRPGIFQSHGPSRAMVVQEEHHSTVARLCRDLLRPSVEPEG